LNLALKRRSLQSIDQAIQCFN